MNALAVVVQGWWVALVSAFAWLAVSIVIGWLAGLVPDRLLRSDRWLTKARAWERDGDRYRCVGVQRWKAWLPETNGLGPGERVTKRTLTRSGLSDYIAETRRAEYVHWAIVAAGPFFLLWNGPVIAAAMIVFGFVFNAPFIVVQRHNRLRALRVQRARARNRTPAGSA